MTPPQPKPPSTAKPPLGPFSSPTGLPPGQRRRDGRVSIGMTAFPTTRWLLGAILLAFIVCGRPGAAQAGAIGVEWPQIVETNAPKVAKVWSKAGRIKAAKLPRKGKVRFVPKKNWNPSEPLQRGPNKGYMDKFGNEWTKGPSRTKGQAFEWDVQRPDGTHWNISLDGKVTH